MIQARYAVMDKMVYYKFFLYVEREDEIYISISSFLQKISLGRYIQTHTHTPNNFPCP